MLPPLQAKTIGASSASIKPVRSMGDWFLPAQALYSGLSFGLGIVVGSAVAGPVWQALGAGTFIVAAAGSVVVAIAWAGVAPRLDRVRR